MRVRRIVGLVLLVGLLGTVFPATSEAGIFGSGPLGELGEPGFFARVLDWVQGLWAGLGEFVTVEGGTPTGGG